MSTRVIASTQGADVAPFDETLPFPEEEVQGSGFTIMQVVNMVWAHAWISAGLFVLLAALSYLAIKSLPKSYNATAALIVHADDVDPLAGRNFSIGQAGTFFPTQVELINNIVMLQPVVERLKLYEDQEFTGGFVGDSKALNDVVVSNLRQKLEVKPGAGSQLLYISVTARDPEKAAAITNAVADEYLRQSNERTNAPAAARAGRYGEQLAQLKSNVDEAAARVAEFRQRHRLANLGQTGGGAGLDEEALADLQKNLLLAQSARRQLENRSLDARADGVLVQQTPEETALRQRLDDLQAELVKQSATLGPRHPRIVQLETEIAALRQEINAGTQKALAVARDLENRYQAELAAAQRRVLQQREVEDQGAKLVLEQKLAEEAYAQALRGLDEVKFASEGNYQDVTLVSRAEPPVKPSKPNKMKLFAAALAASLAMALGGPFAYELLLNRRIRCRDDLERSFRIVTLAEFGPIRQPHAA